MTNVENFGKHLFTILASELISKENPDSSEKLCDITEKNFGKTLSEENLNYSYPNDDVSRSILMLSYVYRPAFTERFQALRLILNRADENAMIYIRCFAETSYKKYSPLKFLIVCSFISEIFIYLSKQLDSKKHSYVQQAMAALNDVYLSIFEQDFPQNGWTCIQNEASKIAKGFKYFEQFMSNETSHLNISQVVNKFATENYVIENGNQQRGVVVAGQNSQEIVNANITSDTSSQISTQISAVPCILPNNQIGLIDSNLTVYTPTFPISFGTIDQYPQLLYLLHASGKQNEVVTFLNQPFGTETKFREVVEITEPSNTESQVQEILTTESSENELEPSFRTMKITESGNTVPCSAEDQFFSEQELVQGEAQFWGYGSSQISEDEVEHSFVTNSETEPNFHEVVETKEPSIRLSQVQENLTTKCSENEPGLSFLKMKSTESGEVVPCSADDQIIAEQELIHGEARFLEYISSQISVDLEVHFFPTGSGTKPKFQKVVETKEPSIRESQAQENLTEKISEYESEPSFLTMRITESGKVVPCFANEQINSRQELIQDEEQFWEQIQSLVSEDEIENSFVTGSRTEQKLQEVVEIEDHSNGQVLEDLMTKCPENEPGSSFPTMKITESDEVVPCSAEDQIISEQELVQDEEQFWKHVQSLISEDEVEHSFATNSEKEPNFHEVVETKEPTIRESQVQENLMTKRSENEPGSSFLTMKITESGEVVPCSAEDQIISEQELIEGETRFLEYVSSQISEDLEEHIFSTVSGTKPKFQEVVETKVPSNRKSKVKENLTAKSSANKPEPSFLTMKITESGRVVPCSADGQIFSERESKQGEAQFWERFKSLIPEDEIENSFPTVSRNTEKNPKRQSERCNQRQSNAALQEITTIEAVSSEKINAQRAMEIEINFPQEKNNISAKEFELDLNGKKIVVRVPEDMSLVFKYKGQTSRSKQP